MTTKSAIPHSTIRAYEETHYIVQERSELTLRIGIESPELRALYETLGMQTAAFLTAWNPYGRVTDHATNEQNQRALKRELDDLGLAVRKGIGEHPAGTWPGEPSFLVVGLTRVLAQQFGIRYAQNAVVFCGPDAIPALLLLR